MHSKFDILSRLRPRAFFHVHRRLPLDLPAPRKSASHPDQNHVPHQMGCGRGIDERHLLLAIHREWIQSTVTGN